MKTALIEINPDWKAVLRAGDKGVRQAAKSGRVQKFSFNYASPELLFSEISPKRWGALEAMSGAGEMSLRELARRLERDVKSVHRDVHAPLETGLLEKNRERKDRVPIRQGARRFHAGTGGLELVQLLMVSPMCFCKTPMLR